jgi:hypothetical protein
MSTEFVGAVGMKFTSLSQAATVSTAAGFRAFSGRRAPLYPSAYSSTASGFGIVFNLFINSFFVAGIVLRS